MTGFLSSVAAKVPSSQPLGGGWRVPSSLSSLAPTPSPTDSSSLEEEKKKELFLSKKGSDDKENSKTRRSKAGHNSTGKKRKKRRKETKGDSFDRAPPVSSTKRRKRESIKRPKVDPSFGLGKKTHSSRTREQPRNPNKNERPPPPTASYREERHHRPVVTTRHAKQGRRRKSTHGKVTSDNVNRPPPHHHRRGKKSLKRRNKRKLASASSHRHHSGGAASMQSTADTAASSKRHKKKSKQGEKRSTTSAKVVPIGSKTVTTSDTVVEPPPHKSGKKRRLKSKQKSGKRESPLEDVPMEAGDPTLDQTTPLAYHDLDPVVEELLTNEPLIERVKYNSETDDKAYVKDDVNNVTVEEQAIIEDLTSITLVESMKEEANKTKDGPQALDSSTSNIRAESPPVAVESTVFEVSGATPPQEPTVHVDDISKENLDMTMPDGSDAKEGDGQPDYSPNLAEVDAMDVETLVDETLSTSDGFSETPKLVGTTDELARSSEESQKEDLGDKMESYQPTLLELPTLDDSTTTQYGTILIAEHNTNIDTDTSNLQNSSQSNDTIIEVDQDVVGFIGDVLEEDVKDWVLDAKSFKDIMGNKTRGGYSVNEDDEANTKEDTTTSDVLSQAPEPDVPTTPEEGCIQTVRPAGVLDRKSLEVEEDKDSDISVSVVTWNLAEESPLEEQAAFIRDFRRHDIKEDTGSDLVLISGQECENIKPRRSEGRRSREFRRLMMLMLGKDYVPIGLHLLGGIQFGLFAKRSLLEEIEDVAIADVTCGIGNVFHNKGAIAAFVTMRARNDSSEHVHSLRRSKYLRLVFVTAHMAAHVKNSEARDADFWRISSELESSAPEGFLSKVSRNVEDGKLSFFDVVDRVFFCGDLNYRLDLPRELTECSVIHGKSDKSPLSDLFRYDQLLRSTMEGRAFPGFAEGMISFAPTFKFDKETNMYDTSHKQRIPAWTDRILFRPAWGIRVKEYASVPDAQHSDHRPVFGSFRVNMEGRELPQVNTKKKRPKKRKEGASSTRTTRRE